MPRRSATPDRRYWSSGWSLGEVAVSVAAKIAKMPAADQAKIDTLAEPALRGAVKKAERAKRESDLGDATRAASESIGRKLYLVIRRSALAI